MKVLMFGWEFPPYISGGLGTACFGLTRHMSDQGTNILFVLPHIKDEPVEDSFLELVAANKVDISDAKIKKIARGEPLKFFMVNSPLRPYMTDNSYLSKLDAIRSINERISKITHRKITPYSVLDTSGEYGRDLLTEVSRYAYIGGYLGATEDFDIIHAHDWMTFPAGVEAKKASGKKLVIHVHATEFDRSGDNVNQQVYDIERYGMENADRIIAVSHRTKNIIVEHYDQDPEKIIVIHNAVIKEEKLAHVRSRKGFSEKIVLFLGRVTMQKGPDYFIEAANLVLNSMQNVRFVMAGTGDMLPRMIERVAELRMQDHFHFTGFLRGVDLETMFSMSDLYVMPSVSEPFGITPFEAMLYGIPVIISKQSGISEVLTHVMMVDFWDIEKLASCIINVLRHPELAETLVESGHNDLEKISWHHAARDVINLYKEMLG
ncbi:MAG: glycosyltransferase [Kiritimatiellae bacterium]|nr:glycosyltransferase [Kiritimatiellia bacterium]MDD5520456.1 glycosyltransferase [Kiritimatiellia bacterium]